MLNSLPYLVANNGSFRRMNAEENRFSFGSCGSSIFIIRRRIKYMPGTELLLLWDGFDSRFYVLCRSIFSCSSLEDDFVKATSIYIE